MRQFYLKLPILNKKYQKFNDLDKYIMKLG
jgi:hypothetical protein